MASSKRPRTMNPEDEDLIQFFIADPAKPPRLETIEGTRGRASKIVFDGLIFNMDKDQLFWELWSKCFTTMLRLPDASEPFVELYTPLYMLTSRTLVICDWKPEHEHYRRQLALLDQERELAKVEQNIIDLTENIEQQKKLAQSLKAGIDELQEQQNVEID